MGAIPSEPEIRYISSGKCNHNINVITAEKKIVEARKKGLTDFYVLKVFFFFLNHCPWKRITVSSLNTRKSELSLVYL